MAAVAEELWRLSVEQYHTMVAQGVISADDPVELLEGLLVRKMGKNPGHRIATKLVAESLEAVVPKGWYVERQEPITLVDSEPEPDVAVIRGNTRDYRHRHPGADAVSLIVEIADSSITRDATLKKRIYANAGIPQYWILDLNTRRLEVHSDPRDGAYTQAAVYNAEASAPVVLDRQECGKVAVSALLP